MRSNIPAYLILFLLMLLAACTTGGTVESIAPSITASQSFVAKATVTATQIPTTPSTATPRPTSRTSSKVTSLTLTPSAVPQPTMMYRKDCITIEDRLPENLHPGGALLLYGGSWESNWRHSMYHLDLMSHRNSPLPSSDGNITLSPDGKWLAYLDLIYDEKGRHKDRILQVTNAEGRHLDMSYWGLNWQYLIGWKDEKHLVIGASGYPSGNYLILNPFNQQKEVIRINTPSAYREFSNPGLSRWIILSKDQVPVWRLLDRNGWETLWKGANTLPNTPIWSPDLHNFALMGDNKLLLISEDGKAVPITNLIGSWAILSWSPDSHFLAGWLQMDVKTPDYESPNHLVLIDVQKPLLTDLCFENQMEKYSIDWNRSPVWSPDGRFFAIGVSRIVQHQERGHSYDETVWDTALIDLQENRAYRLVNDARPQAWMRKP